MQYMAEACVQHILPDTFHLTFHFLYFVLSIIGTLVLEIFSKNATIIINIDYNEKVAECHGKAS